MAVTQSVWFLMAWMCLLAVIGWMARKDQNRQLQLLAAMAMLHPLGRLWQLGGDAYPLAIRGYLSDFGFVASVTATVAIWGFLHRKPLTLVCLWVSVVAAIGSFIFEGIQFALGKGDLMDIVVVALSWVIVLHILGLPTGPKAP